MMVGLLADPETSRSAPPRHVTLKSLMSDLYPDDQRDKALRGLEDRALAGFATGNVGFVGSRRKSFPMRRRPRPSLQRTACVSLGQEHDLNRTFMPEVVCELWSVTPWPASEEYRVEAIWEQPTTPGDSLAIDRRCNSEAVPKTPESSDGWQVELRSLVPVPHAPADAAWKLRVTIVSDFNENRGEPISTTLEIL